MVTTDALRKATGHDWDEWYSVLDTWGGAGRGHGEIVTQLMEEHGVGSWWAQTVTVEYERARGLRAYGGSRDGRFQATASKTIDAPVEDVFAAFTDHQAGWLPDGELRVRTAQAGRSARFDWADGGTRVNVGFVAKGAGKAQVALVHERLEDAEAAEEFKAYWRDRLAALKTFLEG